jgi:hypothetical protein
VLIPIFVSRMEFAPARHPPHNRHSPSEP